MSNQKPQVNPVVHLVAGGAGGTVGAIITSPLDVVKTRLQSSCAQWTSSPQSTHPKSLPIYPNTKLPIDLRHRLPMLSTVPVQCNYSTISPASSRITLRHCLVHIYKTEGVPGLFRGLGPNLVGVAPSRAIYFCAYASSKQFYSKYPQCNHNSSIIHLLSAGTAGFIGCTITNPIWFVKTRLQLDESRGKNKLTVLKCIRNTYHKHGLPGFYRGLTASYMGISETAVNFVIYEKLKEKIVLRARSVDMDHERSAVDFAEFFIAGAISKTFACVTFYPHEVARTRMRQEGDIYRGFFQTLSKVVAEEGYPGLYKGLFTQLVRAIPNTAIMLCTYEIAVHTMSSKQSRTKSESANDDDLY